MKTRTRPGQLRDTTSRRDLAADLRYVRRHISAAGYLAARRWGLPADRALYHALAAAAQRLTERRQAAAATRQAVLYPALTRFQAGR
jgi:hypothetical protein